MKYDGQQDLISGYIDRELTPDERAVVDRLLRSSPEARDQLEQLTEISQHLRSIPPPHLTSDLSESVMEAVGEPVVALARPSALSSFPWKSVGALVTACSFLGVWLVVSGQLDRGTELASRSDAGSSGAGSSEAPSRTGALPGPPSNADQGSASPASATEQSSGNVKGSPGELDKLEKHFGREKAETPQEMARSLDPAKEQLDADGDLKLAVEVENSSQFIPIVEQILGRKAAMKSQSSKSSGEKLLAIEFEAENGAALQESLDRLKKIAQTELDENSKIAGKSDSSKGSANKSLDSVSRETAELLKFVPPRDNMEAIRNLLKQREFRSLKNRLLRLQASSKDPQRVRVLLYVIEQP